MTDSKKKNDRQTQPDGHSISNQHTHRKPKFILQRLRIKCKRLILYRIIIAVLFILLILVFVISCGNTRRQYAEAPVYVFQNSNGYPVNIEKLTSSWAYKAGVEKRYNLTDEERYELAQAITAESAGEPFAGKVAVAQCILQACEDDKIRPDEALQKYEYSDRRPEPTEEALAAVSAVFDFGYVATSEPIKYFYAPDLAASEWHESQVYVMTINNHKFFKEVHR